MIHWDIRARDRTHRSHSPSVIVMHVNVSRDGRFARAVANETAHQQGGYHEIGDDQDVYVTANDDEIVNGASGGNDSGWHYCIIGDAAQTADQWNDPFSRAAVSLAAERVRAAAQRLHVPVVKIDGAQHANGASGLCGHKDVTDSANIRGIKNSQHWDPGPNFPWATFIAQLHGPLTPPQEDDMPKPVMVHPTHKLADGTVPTVLTEYGSHVGLKLTREQADEQNKAGVPTVPLVDVLWKLMVYR